MVLRFVFVKLKEEYSSEEGVAQVLAASRQSFPQIPGVLECRGGRPADQHAGKGWDLCLQLRFASLEDVERYRVHPLHQSFLDEWLEPRTEAKRAWNFSVADFVGQEG